jgi:hypothetical protein
VPEIFTVDGGWYTSTVHSILLAMPMTETISVSLVPTWSSAGISPRQPW